MLIPYDNTHGVLWIPPGLSLTIIPYGLDASVRVALHYAPEPVGIVPQVHTEPVEYGPYPVRVALSLACEGMAVAMFSGADIQQQLRGEVWGRDVLSPEQVQAGAVAAAAITPDGDVLKSDGTPIAFAGVVVPAVSAVNPVALGLSENQFLYALGRSANGDGGGGAFVFRATSTAPVDGGLVFAPTAGTGRLIRDGWASYGHDRAIDPVWYGADPTGATSSTEAFNSALSAFGAGEYRVVIPRPGQYKIDAKLVMPPNTTLDGRGAVELLIQPFANATDPCVQNSEVSNTGPETGSPGIVVRGIIFNGSARTAPAYLSRADGSPVADPEADYRAGGCLAPTVIATASASLSSGKLASVALIDGGQGYVYPPTVWVHGDGVGAVVIAQWDSVTGRVTGFTVRDPGEGYTTCTIEVAGGGANPAVALFAADRRNPLYTGAAPGISLRKCERPLIERCRFVGIAGNCINDAGNDGLIVQFNEFLGCGSLSSVSDCIWSSAYGSVNTQPASFRWSSDTRFRFNTVRGQLRSVALIGGDGFWAYGNDIRGFRESGFFKTNERPGTRLFDNLLAGGLSADITCSGFEMGRAAGVYLSGNTTQDIDGPAVIVRSSQTEIAHHTHTATIPTLGGTNPFGPISERVARKLGTRAVAGVNKPISAGCVVRVHDVDASTIDDAATGVSITGGKLIDPNGYLPYVLHLGRGALHSVKELSINGFDITGAPSVELFDPDVVDEVMAVDSHFKVRACPGHASMGGVTVTQTISAGTTGTVRLVVGYRPSSALLTVQGTGEHAAQSLAATYTDDGGGGSISLASSAGSVIFAASLGAPASDGINLTVTTCTSGVAVTVQAQP